ncbi:MAG: hypothetical protein ACRC7S_16390 [Cetobacterium sp.]
MEVVYMRGIYNQFVNTGIGASEASRRVDNLVKDIGEHSTVNLFTGYEARFDYETYCVDIYNIGTGECVNSIPEYVGELWHCADSCNILYRLVYDSMMSMPMILGRA